MNKEILYEILNSESECLTTAEIDGILNEELDKSADEMDTDLVDLCLEALSTVDQKQLNKKKRKLNFTKLLVAAIIFVLLVGIGIPVCARFFSINVPEGIVSFYDDCFSIDISKDEGVSDILAQLQQDGVSDAVLPKVIFSPDTVVSDYHSGSDNSIDVEFSFTNGDIYGYVSLKNYDDLGFDNDKATVEFEKVNEFNVNGNSVLVFGNNEFSYIYYCKDGIAYDISVNCDYETACQIAKTI